MDEQKFYKVPQNRNSEFLLNGAVNLPLDSRKSHDMDSSHNPPITGDEHMPPNEACMEGIEVQSKGILRSDLSLREAKNDGGLGNSEKDSTSIYPQTSLSSSPNSHVAIDQVSNFRPVSEKFPDENVADGSHSTPVINSDLASESSRRILACNRHDAIGSQQLNQHVDDDRTDAHEHTMNNGTSTACNNVLSDSNTEVQDVEMGDVDKSSDSNCEKSGEGVQSQNVYKPESISVGETQHSPLETGSIDSALFTEDLSNDSSLSLPTLTDDHIKLTEKQKAPSKARGNTMIFVPELSEELLQGYRILTEIFGDKCKSFVWPFLDPVDTKTLWDYESKIKHPMWLRKIESKFLNKEYQSITEFAVDMRQMLENCYRYNGIKHQISKYAQTLECVFEQKLALLSRPLQEKTTLYVTSDGKYSDGCPNTIELSSGRLRRACTRLAVRAMEQAAAAPLAYHIRQELEQQQREEKRQKIVDRRDEIVKERQDLLEWDKQLIGETEWTYMMSVWEIPAIGHFLCLCQSVLELDEISYFELERSFAIPMESMILRRIFTTLLSTPYQRQRLAKKPPMPYKVWEARLREWVRGWYVVYDKLADPLKVYEKIGVPERFFEVVGPNFPLDRVQYHELAYYERVWIMKALCDQLFETQLSIRRCILSQPVEEQRPIILGIDAQSNTYIHFPQFCGADLRIYRQAKYPDLLKASKRDKVKAEEPEDFPEKESASPPPPKQRKIQVRKKKVKTKPVVIEMPRVRPSRLRQKLTPTVHYGTYAESIESSTESEDVTSEFTEVDDAMDDSDIQQEVSAKSLKIKKVKGSSCKDEEESTVEVLAKSDHREHDSDIEQQALVTSQAKGKTGGRSEDEESAVNVLARSDQKGTVSYEEEGDVPKRYSGNGHQDCTDDELSKNTREERYEAVKATKEVGSEEEAKDFPLSIPVEDTEPFRDKEEGTEDRTSNNETERTDGADSCSGEERQEMWETGKVELKGSSNETEEIEPEGPRRQGERGDTKGDLVSSCRDYEIRDETQLLLRDIEEVGFKEMSKNTPNVQDQEDRKLEEITSLEGCQSTCCASVYNKSNAQDLSGSSVSQRSEDGWRGIDKKNQVPFLDSEIKQNTECSSITEALIRTDVKDHEVALKNEECLNRNNCSNLSSDVDGKPEPISGEPAKPEPSVLDVKPPVTTITADEDPPPSTSPPKPHVAVLPVLGEFELVCDSMDSLRELVDKFAPPENKPASPPTGRKRKAAVQAKLPVRKRCEKELHEKFTNLLLELTPWEGKLAKFAMRSRERFRKQYEIAKEAPKMDQDIKDIWASEESSSESEIAELESEQDDKEVPVDDQDEEWNAKSEGMRLRKRPHRKRPPTSANQEEGEKAESITSDASEAPHKPKRPRPSSKRGPPHKNQLNTSLMEMIRKLPTDSLKEACKRLQTMVRRGEATRHPKAKIDPDSLAESHKLTVIEMLKKPFWVAAKPPAVEGDMAKSIEELISLYPIFVQNLIFRNIKNNLSRMNNAAKMDDPGPDKDTWPKVDDGSAEKPAEEDKSTKESEQQTSTEPDRNLDLDSTPSRMKTRFSVSNTPKENVVKLGTASKSRDVMDDCVLHGLYTILFVANTLLRERLATGLSEFLPGYSNLQEGLVKTQPSPEKPGKTPKKETDKDLLLKMLPKPSEYLKPQHLPSVENAYVKYVSNRDVESSAGAGQALLVPVPTSKLPAIPKNLSKQKTRQDTVGVKEGENNAQPTFSVSDAQSGSKSGSVPHGVYTIKVDASVWTQLQGKPALQQQFVLQQIKEMQRKQADTGASSPAKSPAQAVTCIRSLPKSPVTTPNTTMQTLAPKSPGRSAGRIAKTTDLSKVADITSLQPIKLNKPVRPKPRPRSGFGELAANLTQKELIALLQQQQKQLELHRQQQQEKLMLKKAEEQQHHTNAQIGKQSHKIGAGVVATSSQLHLPEAPGSVNILLSSGTQANISNLSIQSTASPSLSTQPTRLTTKTTVTSSVKQPKMAANLAAPQPTLMASPIATTPTPTSGHFLQSPTVAHVPVSLRAPGGRFQLVQTNKGTQLLLHTPSTQTPRLGNLSSTGVGGSGTVSILLPGQDTQVPKQVLNQIAVSVGKVASNSSGVQSPKIVLHANPQSGTPASGTVQGNVSLAAQPRPQENKSVKTFSLKAGTVIDRRQDAAPAKLTTPVRTVVQSEQVQQQSHPGAIQRTQPSTSMAFGDSKVAAKTPGKVVKIVWPSHLSTATTSVEATTQSPQSKPGALTITDSKSLTHESQGLLTQSPQRQHQLIYVSQGTLTGAHLQAPAASTSGVTTQEQLKQVILQQLASGKLKLSTQPPPIQTLGPAVSQHHSLIQQSNAGNTTKTLPVVISQQAPQPVSQIQQSVPATLATVPIAGVVTGPQFCNPAQTNISRNIQILGGVKSVQNSPVRIIAAADVIRQTQLSVQGQQTHVPSPKPPRVSSVNQQLPVINSPPKLVVCQAQTPVSNQVIKALNTAARTSSNTKHQQ